MNSRRQFIKCCSGAFLGSAVVPGFGALASAAPAATLTFATFSRLLEQTFALIAESSPVIPVTLARIEPFSQAHRPEAKGAENFNVYFTSPSPELLEQGTYTFKHPALGEIELFVVPQNDPVSGGTHYVATFHNSTAA